MIDALQPHRFGDEVQNAATELQELERDMGRELPPILKNLLIRFKGAIGFDQSVVFKPRQETPLNDKQGNLSLEVLFGPGRGKHGIQPMRDRYRDQLPTGMLPIGEAFGGNLICLSHDDAVYFWHHEDPGDGLYLAADSSESFFDSLEIEMDEGGGLDGVIESESWLDF